MNILIIGKNGFIASSLSNLFPKDNYNVTQTSSSELDFMNEKQVDDFMNSISNFEYIIFTPVYGGRRTIEDSEEIVEKNKIMYNNLLKHKKKFKLIFYFGSGAAFDRNTNISNFDNNKLGDSIPNSSIDSYGYSKYYIENNIRNHDNIINLRIFNCFGINESFDRMIKANILNYINNQDIIIHQDRYFDFIYIDDLYNIILSFIDNKQSNKEINCVYEENLKLSDIGSIINEITNQKVQIKIINSDLGNSYTGKKNYQDIKNLIGLKNGINCMYQNIINKINLVNLKENIKCIIFDFDDTLVWSEEIKKQTFINLVKEYGVNEEKYMKEVRDENKYTRYQIFQKFCNQFNILSDYENLLDKYKIMTRKEIIKTDNLPGVIELLDYLREKTQLKIFISSKSSKEDLDYYIQERIWNKYFDGVYGLPDDKTYHINDIKNKFNFTSNEILFIGDSLGDYQVSMKNNLYFIGVDNSALDNLNCKKISNLYDIKSIISSNC